MDSRWHERLIHSFATLLDALDSKGGHLLILLFILHVGVGLHMNGSEDLGNRLLDGAIGALLYSMKTERTANGVEKPKPEDKK